MGVESTFDPARLHAFARRVARETPRTPQRLTQPLTVTTSASRTVPGGLFRRERIEKYFVSENVATEVGQPCFVLDQRFISEERTFGGKKYEERTARVYCLTPQGVLAVQSWTVRETTYVRGLTIEWVDDPSLTPMGASDMRLFDFTQGRRVTTRHGVRLVTTDIRGRRALYETAGVGLSVCLKRLLSP